MDSLSKEQLTYFKNKKKLTNKTVAELTKLPISSVDKVFSGLNKNPTLDTLKKIADVLDCSVDDFISYDKEPQAGYYADRQTEKIAKAIQGNEALKELFGVATELSEDDLKLVAGIADRLSKSS